MVPWRPWPRPLSQMVETGAEESVVCVCVCVCVCERERECVSM